jgi:hypothetical protein
VAMQGPRRRLSVRIPRVCVCVCVCVCVLHFVVLYRVQHLTIALAGQS